MADLDQERADLNALIREAHEATKDLKQASKDLDAKIGRADEIGVRLVELLDEWEKRVHDLAEQQVQPVVDDTIGPIVEEFLTSITANIELVQDAIYKRFEVLADELTAGAGKSAWNDMSLPDYLASIRIDRKED